MAIKISKSTLLLLFIFFCCSGFNASAQYLSLTNTSYTKVDAEIDEVFTDEEFKYLDSKGECPDVDVHVKDSITIFFISSPEGVYQVFTRKRPLSFAQNYKVQDIGGYDRFVKKEHSEVLTIKKQLKKQLKFNDVFTTDFPESVFNLNKLYTQLGCSTNTTHREEFYDNYQYRLSHREGRIREELTSFNRSKFHECNLPLLLEKPKQAQWIYYPFSILYFRYKDFETFYLDQEEKEEVLSSTQVLQPYYIFSSYKMRLTSEELKSIYNFPCNNKLSYMHEIYIKLFDKWFTSYEEDYYYGFPLLTQKKLEELSKVKASYDDSNRLANMKKWLEKDYETQFLKSASGERAYTIKQDGKLNKGRRWMVYPGKFFISTRLKILSVDDKPWHEYKFEEIKYSN